MQVLEASGFCFLFARSFHPGMRHVGPIRAQLGLPTIFNILGAPEAGGVSRVR